MKKSVLDCYDAIVMASKDEMNKPTKGFLKYETPWGIETESFKVVPFRTTAKGRVYKRYFTCREIFEIQRQNKEGVIPRVEFSVQY